MSLLPQDQLEVDIESGKDNFKKCQQFIRDQEFYERLSENPDWLKFKGDLTRERSELILKRDELLKLLVETRGSDKVNIQDGILECQIRLDQFDAFMNAFDVKVAQLKLAREQLPEIKTKLNELQEALHG